MVGWGFRLPHEQFPLHDQQHVRGLALDQAHPLSARESRGQNILQPCYLRGQPDNLRVQLFALPLVSTFAGTFDLLRVVEQTQQPFKSLGFPLTELRGVEAVQGWHLGRGLLLLQDFEHDLRLVVGGVVFSHGADSIFVRPILLSDSQGPL